MASSRTLWTDSLLSRRRVLQLMAAAGAATAIPGRLLLGARAGTAPLPPYGFLTSEELAILDAATAAILPTDALPGAREIGVTGYIQSLLSFMPGSDANCDAHVNVADLTATALKAHGQEQSGVCPGGGDVNGDEAVDDADVRAAEAATFRARPMFAGGPFSGRSPQPHFPIGNTPCSACHGVSAGAAAGRVETQGSGTVDVYPPAAFRKFLPLNRLQRLSWKLRILGKDSVPESAGNPLLDSIPEVNLRQKYRDGLAQLESISQQRFGTPFATLPAQQRETVFQFADQRFIDLLHRHVIQGVFCVPEYGGNHDRRGWQMTGFDGDSQPLGYEIYDESEPGFYRQRPDKPNRDPNPDEDCRGYSEKMKEFLDLISSITGGGPLGDPYCFEVDR